jgi:hypothetical protein
MIHGKVVEKFYSFSLPRAPNLHRLNRAPHEGAPRKGSAAAKGSAFGEGGDGFAVEILGHGLSLQKDIQGASSPVCLFGATRFLP